MYRGKAGSQFFGEVAQEEHRGKLRRKW